MGPRFAFVTDWIESLYHFGLFEGAREYCRRHDISIFAVSGGALDSPFVWERGKNNLFRMVSAENFDGVIILTATLGAYKTPETMIDFIKLYAPLPTVSLGLEVEGVPSVVIDNAAGMRKLLLHLVRDHGKKRLAYIKGQIRNPDIAERFQTYRDILKECDIPFDENIILEGEYNFESGVKAVRELIDVRNGKFDAVVCANDRLALGVLHELNNRSILVPDEVAVSGFDDIQTDSYDIIPCTTVRQPLREMGYKAAELLHLQLSGGKYDGCIIIPTRLMIRSTCGCFSSEENDLEVQGSLTNILIPKIPFLLEHDGLRILFTELESVITQNEINTSRLFSTWRIILNHFMHMRIHFTTVNTILSIIRKMVIDRVSVPKIRRTIENLFHRMRQMTAELILSHISLSFLSTIAETDLESSAFEELVNATSLEELSPLIHLAMVNFGVKNAVICLFTGTGGETDRARIFLEINDGILLESRPVEFKSADLLPTGNFLLKTRKEMLVKPLAWGEREIGYIITDGPPRVYRRSENLTRQIATYFLYVKNLEESRDRNIVLENLVARRTGELKKTNAKLKIEISEKEQIENELRMTLMRLERSNKLLENKSQRDELTGLLNRRGFFALAQDRLETVKKLRTGIAVYYADLDSLKEINDTYGHLEGDNAIIATGQLLIESFRQHDLIARIGGDEFTVLIERASEERAEMILGRLRERFERYNLESNKPYILSISIGFVITEPDDGLSLEDILSKADTELYRIKKKKRQDKSSK